MLLEMSLTRSTKLECSELVTFLFETANDFSYQTSLYTVWLDSNTAVRSVAEQLLNRDLTMSARVPCFYILSLDTKQ